MSLAPLMAATLAWPLLGERIGVLGGLAITVALGDLVVKSRSAWTHAGCIWHRGKATARLRRAAVVLSRLQ